MMNDPVKYLLMALLFVGIIACEKAEDPTPQDIESKVDGEWKLRGYEQSGEVRDENGVVISTSTVSGFNFQGTIDFDEEGTFSNNIGFDILTVFTVPAQNLVDTTYGQRGLLPAGGLWDITTSGDFQYISGLDTTVLDLASATTRELIMETSFLNEDTTVGLTTSSQTSFILRK